MSDASSEDLSFRDVFAEFPYGILVLDRAGAVVAANGAARSLVGRLRRNGAAVTCCELFGCQRPDGPLVEGCLTELARDADGTLPEVRVDLPKSPGGAGWVTAAPMTGSGRVMLQLRPGALRDRRRRTEPHWSAGPQLRIRTLGRTVVASGEGPIGGEWLKQRPGQLLKYMVCERGRTVYPDEIVDIFWPDAGRGGLNNVRHFIHALRDRLEPNRPHREPSSFVLTRNGGYALDLDKVELDVGQFESLVSSGMSKIADEAAVAGVEDLKRAVALYQGDFLADEPYSEWTLCERDRLRHLVHQALQTLADERLAREDIVGAAYHLEKLGEIEPFDIAVHHDIIELCLRRGRQSEAVRRYQSLRSRLVRTFGEEPGFTLGELGLALQEV
jgi:DNA-binding SARP family transcriptional activator